MSSTRDYWSYLEVFYWLESLKGSNADDDDVPHFSDIELDFSPKMSGIDDNVYI